MVRQLSEPGIERVAALIQKPALGNTVLVQLNGFTGKLVEWSYVNLHLDIGKGARNGFYAAWFVKKENLHRSLVMESAIKAKAKEEERVRHILQFFQDNPTYLRDTSREKQIKFWERYLKG